jgi:winged helix DNA-binding protein
VRRLSAVETRVARVRAQGLGGGAGTVVDAVRRVVGVQAQDVRASRLAVRVRSHGLTADDVDAACRDRSVVRTWAMRGTLHMLAAEDFGWVTGLLGPYFAKKGAPRRRQLDLDDTLLERAAIALEDIAREPLTRRDLVERLADKGVRLDPRSQQPAHLVSWAANTGLLCRGPDLAKDEPTYVLVREWLGPRRALDEDEALARLAERYLRGHGPADADDLAMWSGLPVTKARAGLAAIEAKTDVVEAAGGPATVLVGDEQPDAPTRLLGHFDAYLLGYHGRDLAVPEPHRKSVQAGGGFVMPVVLSRGEVVGTWRLRSTKDSIAVATGIFHDPESVDLGAEVTDLGRFLRRQVALEAPIG